jgi:hypothetical protein
MLAAETKVDPARIEGGTFEEPAENTAVTY